MVCSLFTCLLLGLLLSMASFGDSNITIAHQAMEGVANGHIAIIANKEIEVDTEGVTTIRRNWLRGRKMWVDDLEKTKMRSKMKTGANPSKFEKEGKGGLNVGGELRVRKIPPPSRFKLVGLIPFSSDYHAPKNHPPKHN